MRLKWKEKKWWKRGRDGELKELGEKTKNERREEKWGEDFLIKVSEGELGWGRYEPKVKREEMIKASEFRELGEKTKNEKVWEKRREMRKRWD